MLKLNLSPKLEEKIFEIREASDETISKIISYFPLTKEEQNEIHSNTNQKLEFRSIFSDTVTEEEWNRTKEQIKKKFRDELIGID